MTIINVPDQNRPDLIQHMVVSRQERCDTLVGEYLLNFLDSVTACLYPKQPRQYIFDTMKDNIYGCHSPLLDGFAFQVTQTENAQYKIDLFSATNFDTPRKDWTVNATDYGVVSKPLEQIVQRVAQLKQ